ncbi:hypothetical protein Hanom_Chr08g00742001 [Helianthus anomalus]
MKTISMYTRYIGTYIQARWVIIDLANGSGRVGLGHGSKRVRVRTGSGQNGSIKKRVVLVRVGTGSGRNGFGSERVRVEMGPGQSGFRVGSGQFC